MKTRKSMIAAGFALLSALPALALEKEGGGGNIFAAEFATVGRAAIEILGLGDPSLNLPSILESIRDVKVVPVDELCKTEPVYGKTYCEDAHYDKSNHTVLFAYSRWDSMSCREKLILSTHEFLRAAELEGEDYGYSGRFLSDRVTKCDSHTDEMHCAELTVMVYNEINSLCRNIHQLREQRRTER
ncbi:MAG: hypothetical protein NDJ90_03995 [Oligoflexia bacterium]|nr:hypothetical protein [Oligoflexia bacterium]